MAQTQSAMSLTVQLGSSLGVEQSLSGGGSSQESEHRVIASVTHNAS
jgi:hypothetical protein